MDSQTGPTPTTYGAAPPTAHPAQVRTAYRIAAWIVLALSAPVLVGAVVLCVYAATDPGEYSSFGYLFALFLLVPMGVALSLLAAAHWLRHRSPVFSLVLACVAAAGMTWLALGALSMLVPM
ncbi:hypothetical protein I601_0971 [Nocardioides dokdonensis FR1436]|uniref:Uncharacterized protein n=1 Tax=Nocardioides dokdonensis FR1436 TaxID=1300347 RepID=A0A1A9GGQ1_9ACTN|nr:hypothetical protein [Nocardioides dokdonensis]ANH37414.1 hypothetical protein I601_0971 [Nocardioides dokdonensis FR1436]